MINPLSNYGLVVSVPDMTELVLSVYLNTTVNILRLRSKERDSIEYNISMVAEKSYIYAKKRVQPANAEQKPILGFDRKYKVLYTHFKDLKKVKAFFASFTPLDENELSRVHPRALEGIRIGQKNVIETLQQMDFIPPFFGLQSAAPREFGALPYNRLPGQVLSLDNVSKEGPAQFFKSLLLKNKGLFIGHTHTELEKLGDFLISHMEDLFASGVRHIYDELPAWQLYNALHQFNTDPSDTGENLKDVLINEVKAVDVEEKMKIYRAAQKAGIQIWAIDSHLISTNANERIIGDGDIMMRNIAYFAAKLKAEERFLTVNGLAHFNIAKELSIPFVSFCESGIPSSLYIQQSNSSSSSASSQQSDSSSSSASSQQSNSSSSSASSQQSNSSSSSQIEEKITKKNLDFFMELSEETLEGMNNPDFQLMYDTLIV